MPTQALKRHPGSQKTLRMRAATPSSAHRRRTFRHRTPVRLQQIGMLLQLRPRGGLRVDALRPCSIGVLQAANLPRRRQRHTATLRANGHVLIAASDDNSSDYLTDTVCFDPVVNAWRRVGQLSAGREYCTATLLAHGGTLLAGGDGSGGHLTSSGDARGTLPAFGNAFSGWPGAGCRARGAACGAGKRRNLFVDRVGGHHAACLHQPTARHPVSAHR